MYVPTFRIVLLVTSKMAHYVGSKILIHAEDGTYEGVVHSIDLQNKRITLNKGFYERICIGFTFTVFYDSDCGR